MHNVEQRFHINSLLRAQSPMIRRANRVSTGAGENIGYSVNVGKYGTVHYWDHICHFIRKHRSRAGLRPCAPGNSGIIMNS